MRKKICLASARNEQRPVLSVYGARRLMDRPPANALRFSRAPIMPVDLGKRRRDDSVRINMEEERDPSAGSAS